MPPKQPDLKLERERTRREIIIAIISAFSGIAIALIGAGILVTRNSPPQVIDLTPSPTNSGILPIESFPLQVVAYEGKDNLADPSAGSNKLKVIYDADVGTSYIVDYSLPDSGKGNAGIAFKFSELQDLTKYKFIEVTISFSDEQAKCELFMKDNTDTTDAVRLSNNVVNARIALSTNYDAVNRKFIKEIGCHVGTDFSRGIHTFTIQGIKFVDE